MKPFLFSLFFFFFFFQTQIVFSATTLSLEILSLLALKNSIVDPHKFLHDWDPASTFTKSNYQDPVWCSWTGITCHSRTSQITNLDLSNRNLSGTIPPEIRYLSSLVHLNLSGNDFGGNLQAAIFQLSELRTLDISHNYFNSTFPPGISKLKFLTVFNAYSNNFIGPLPEEFIRLRFLEQLNLGGSYFSDRIPSGYGSFPRLKILYLAGNALEGPIPPQLGFLAQLERLEIGYNNFSGELPAELALLSNLKYLDISSANLSGRLRPELGNLTSLENLLLFKNHFTDQIPSTLGNLKVLKALDLSDNQLTGSIPQALGTLKELTKLSLMMNKLTGEIPQEFGDLPNLELFHLFNNSLSGFLPQKLGSNGLLQRLDVSTNSLSGPMPPTICNGNNVIKLILFNNKFQGLLPASLTKCSSLTRLRIQNNGFNGSIPAGFGSLPNLTFVDLSNNNFTGQIPEDFGNAIKLQYLNISGNSFNNPLPNNIWNAVNLQIFSASSSKIVGHIPDFDGCQSIYRIELQGNSLNGSIPWKISHCQKLLLLNLSRNSLTGIIPWEISVLPSITDVDLSHNFLTGTIPSNFNNCTTLENFNVSFNLLTGPIPSSGSIFPNLHPSSFSGNEGLCGGILSKPCAADTLAAGDNEVELQKQQPKRTAGAIVWIIAAAFGIGLFVLVAGTRCFHANYNRRFSTDSQEIGPWRLTAFQRLNFTAEDVLECLSMTDKILGMGSTGTVYKAEMPGGEIIAVKKLWGKHKDHIRRRRGVLAEVDVLDGEMEARVADFGVAKLIQSDESMSVIAGSYGYIAPEYAYTLQVDEKSDIYSYGVVLMEILSGKRSVDPEFGDGNSIVDWVRLKIKSKDGVDEILDKNCGAGCGAVKEEMLQMLRIALLCTSGNPSDRPSMRDVVLMLQEAQPKRKLLESVVGRCGGHNVGGGGGGDILLPQKPTLET
ncbi:hypothetical protein L6164_017566 [Bauhinia variegata]|uniref:Uncharacterized protein n=1 Tax=Bauhinia variegata TaxID=167791 RepID=A0ACB9N8X3_BAUVA|nr:hypothetical protein L6164_017566 [Bauhinia variegata]